MRVITNAINAIPNITIQIPKLSPVIGEFVSSFSPVIGKLTFPSGISFSSTTVFVSVLVLAVVFVVVLVFSSVFVFELALGSCS